MIKYMGRSSIDKGVPSGAEHILSCQGIYTRDAQSVIKSEKHMLVSMLGGLPKMLKQRGSGLGQWR